MLSSRMRGGCPTGISGRERASTDMHAEPIEQNGRRLKTWKEIAAFFGCDERTVRRWEEAYGLPVRRVPNSPRSAVFAYEGELRAWLNVERARAAAPESLAGDNNF